MNEVLKFAAVVFVASWGVRIVMNPLILPKGDAYEYAIMGATLFCWVVAILTGSVAIFANKE